MTTQFDLFSGTPLLVLAICLLVVGAAFLVAPFLGVGAKRPDPALEAVLRQIEGYDKAAPAREAFDGIIVEDSLPARQLALTAGR